MFFFILPTLVRDISTCSTRRCVTMFFYIYLLAWLVNHKIDSCLVPEFISKNIFMSVHISNFTNWLPFFALSNWTVCEPVLHYRDLPPVGHFRSCKKEEFHSFMPYYIHLFESQCALFVSISWSWGLVSILGSSQESASNPNCCISPYAFIIWFCRCPSFFDIFAKLIKNRFLERVVSIPSWTCGNLAVQGKISSCHKFSHHLLDSTDAPCLTCSILI